jgi:hypothetical protein
MATQQLATTAKTLFTVALAALYQVVGVSHV